MDPGTSAARHMIARSRCVSGGSGCVCACCGASLFGAGRPSSAMFGDAFTDFDWLADPSLPNVCAGCVSILAGRPGDDPPPLRTLHCLAVEGAPAAYPGTADVAALLRAPPAGRFVLAFAASRKRHAALRARVSTAERLYVGTDEGTVTYVPAEHSPVLDAVEALLVRFGRDDIRTGGYAACSIAAFGPARWLALDTVVAPHRPSPLLDLLCVVARRPEPSEQPQESAPMIDIDDERAAELLSYLAEASAFRRRDGLTFWKGYFRHRLGRFAGLPLRDAVSRLIDALQCEPGDALSGAILGLDALDPGEVPHVERALRQRGPLVLAYAHSMMRARVDARIASQRSA